ncbi:hypothetical protein [Actinomadura sp. CNU-125]|uniref:hypothetical protein n=1 Tax=Actinomadura sp. CNU-125 TaxID=1904961 RepID=UPI0011779538|nr:hypothetical protein [Actinomadura sp. CNU-125]
MGNYLREGDPDWGWEFRCEDFIFARLDEDRASADKLDSAARQAERDRIGSLRRIAGWHSTYVDQEGRSHARCFTCEPSHGFPCTTLRNLAGLWRAHPDYIPGWTDEGTFLADVFELGGFRRAFLAKARSDA